MADQASGQGPNEKFIEYLKKLGSHPTGYRVAHVQFSALPESVQTRDNLTRGIRAFAQMRAKFNEGDIFLLTNMDLVFVTKLIARHHVGNACQELLTQILGRSSIGAAPGGGEYYQVFELSREYGKALAWAEATISKIPPPDPDKPVFGVPAATDKAIEDKATTDAILFARIKAEVKNGDIGAMLFNQPAFDISDINKVQTVFNETYISVGVLEQVYCPGLSLTARKWLFNDLTEDLDAVVLKFLSDPKERHDRKQISLNMNISTLASDVFAKFDESLTPDYREQVVLEVNKTDMFDNNRAFQKIAPSLRKAGYRLLLDGLTLDIAPDVDFDNIEFDLAKVFWDGQFADDNPDVLAKVQRKMQRELPRFILARCDSVNALHFARGAGVTLVQGRYLDQMMRNKGAI